MQLGRHDVDALLEEMTLNQLIEWREFEEVAGPFLDRRLDFLLSRLTYITSLGTVQNPSPGKFTVPWAKTAHKDAAGMEKALKMFAMAHNERLGRGATT